MDNMHDDLLDDLLDSALRRRSVPPMSAHLSVRIIAAAEAMPVPRRAKAGGFWAGITGFLDDMGQAFLVPRPILAMLALLFLSFAAGFYNEAPDFSPGVSEADVVEFMVIDDQFVVSEFLEVSSL
ncbi:MAG: hypothetical protein KDI46_06960 [Alphaproteobacteria bacterium]|nr:hypothetical protein [Alphaproteobacteria bacterium]